jgi:hypothetical protein
MAMMTCCSVLSQRGLDWFWGKAFFINYSLCGASTIEVGIEQSHPRQSSSTGICFWNQYNANRHMVMNRSRALFQSVRHHTQELRD